VFAVSAVFRGQILYRYYIKDITNSPKFCVRWRGDDRVDYLDLALIFRGKPAKKWRIKKRGLAAMDVKKKKISKSLAMPAVNAGAGDVEKVGKKTLPDYNKPMGKKKSEWILFVPDSGPTDDQFL
jgi:hypothetical protein